MTLIAPRTGSAKRRVAVVALFVACATLAAGLVNGQNPWRRGWSGWGERIATPESFDGAFNFCRVMYQSRYFARGGSWYTDYPSADINLSIRLSELTKMSVSQAPDGSPNHLVVRLTDPELFQCPFVLMAEVGRLHFSDEEAAQLRTYLLKGGFLWVDDFWGPYEWAAWEEEVRRVFPPGDYPIVDLPDEHPLFRTMYDVPGVPQIPSINYWHSSGGGTSQQGAASATPHARAIFNTQGDLMVLMTHNTDIADSWEREGDDPNYFYRFSVEGYAMAINVLLYAMSH